MSRTAKVELPSFTVEDATMPTVVHRGPPNPFVEHLRASGTTGAKQIVVPNGEATDRAQYLIRRAATELDVGVRIVTEDAGNGNTRVMFKAKAKRATLTPEQRAARDAEAQAKRDKRAKEKAAKAKATK